MTSNIRPFASLTVLALLLASAAQAQQPAAPAAAPNVDVPAMSCVNPGSPPLDRAGSDMTRFSKRVEDYKVCINEYTRSTGAKANELAAQSRAYADAANKAIDDYNTYVTALNEKTKSPTSGGSTQAPAPARK